MNLLKSIEKHAIFKTFVFAFVICGISSAHFHGIRIPDEAKEKILSKIEPEVDVNQGTIKGTAELSRNGRVYLSFKGIPFGKIIKRFSIAEPADPWQGVLKTNEYGAPCAQLNIFKKSFQGKEDCLSLNVFVPKTETASAEPLPVMVYIYGGAFIVGESSTYKPDYFMDEDVILVSLAYRVGAFGFFNAGIKGASGNQGYKDLVLGLKWVQDNIQVFGGDPSKVTIFGYSAGGAAVSALVASPMAKGLFHAAIGQSVVSIAPITQFPDPQHQEAKKLAQVLDCPTSNTEYMVECLRKIKPEEISVATHLDSVWFKRDRYPVVAPTIETYRESENDTNVFLSENIETIMKEGRFNRVPYFTGISSHEGFSLNAVGVLINPINTKKMNEQWGRIAPYAFFYWSTAKDPCVVSSKLKNAYFQGKPVGFETADNLERIYTDIIFRYPVRTMALLHSTYAPVYAYNFTKTVKGSLMDIYGWKSRDPSAKPPTHGDEVQFHFPFAFLPPIGKDSSEYEFSVNYVKLFTSFAKDKKPTYVWGDKVKDVPPFNASDSKQLWLTVDNELSLVQEDDYLLQRMALIDEIRKNDMDLPA